MQSNSRSRLLRLRDLPAARRRNTLIELDQGRVDATVAPQSPGSGFQVKTPLATAGVLADEYRLNPPLANLMVGISILLSFCTMGIWWLVLEHAIAL